MAGENHYRRLMESRIVSGSTAQEEAGWLTIDESRLILAVDAMHTGKNSQLYHGTYDWLPVCVKIFPSNERMTFLREATTLSQLKHENIVKCIGTSESYTKSMIVMKFLQGRKLKDLLDNLRLCCKLLPFPTASGYALDIARAMEYVHQKKFVHRDLRTDNVIITENHNRAVLIDFGSSSKQETLKDHKGDVLSFGCILWDLITSKTPYQELRSNEMRPSLDDVPDQVKSLLIHCLAANPDDRIEFYTIRKVLEQLADNGPKSRYVDMFPAGGCFEGLEYEGPPSP